MKLSLLHQVLSLSQYTCIILNSYKKTLLITYKKDKSWENWPIAIKAYSNTCSFFFLSTGFQVLLIYEHHVDWTYATWLGLTRLVEWSANSDKKRMHWSTSESCESRWKGSIFLFPCQCLPIALMLQVLCFQQKVC